MSLSTQEVPESQGNSKKIKHRKKGQGQRMKIIGCKERVRIVPGQWRTMKVSNGYGWGCPIRPGVPEIDRVREGRL